MFATSRGSEILTGAVSMKYRIPARGRFPLLDIAQLAERQIDDLRVADSNPAVAPIL